MGASVKRPVELLTAATLECSSRTLAPAAGCASGTPGTATTRRPLIEPGPGAAGNSRPRAQAVAASAIARRPMLRTTPPAVRSHRVDLGSSPRNLFDVDGHAVERGV